ncbi:MAG: hypothetical protein JO241_01530, partial [Candidatus Eremiobacteraeota bacterium]|nr:hypothetical protein [Candidatus Eremiobacteraeota bacterium]
MTAATGPSAREAAYRDVERFLEADPSMVPVRHQRACLLGLLGRRDEAQAAFVELLGHDPKNFGVLNDFGMFLFSGGLRKAALVALGEAVKWHPDNSVAHTNLASLLLTDGDLVAARAHFELAVQLDPTNPQAHEGLSLILARLGDSQAARAHQPTIVRKATALKPFPQRGAPVRVLLVESAIGGNIFAHALLDAPAFDVRQVFLEYLDAHIPLPEHDVVWNAIGDAERCEDLLAVAPATFARTQAALVNPPGAILHTSRLENARRFRDLPGVRAPRVERVPRNEVARAAGRFTFPLLLRSPGFHTGEYFVRVERPAELDAAVAALPGRELLLIEFLDVRSADGNVRKYRAVIVDGKLYPLHAAVAGHWKVHYFSADMTANAAHRAEDAAFLRDMQAVIGSKAIRALDSIRKTLGLDYGGIDFALDASGNVVVFEAN